MMKRIQLARRMAIATVLAILAVATPSRIVALPAPPPPKEKLEALKRFFDALPKSVPASNFDKLRPLVSPVVQVYREGQLRHQSRDSWFGELARFSGPGSATRATISRERFFEAYDRSLVVLEFSILLPPPEDVGQIQIHTAYPFRFVTYSFTDGLLTRVDYGLPLEAFSGLDPQGPPWPAPYSGWPRS